MKKKITNLIVGGGGQDAFFLSRYLLKKKEKVILLTNKKNKIKIINKRNITHKKLNIFSQNKVFNYLKKFSYLKIFFLASHNLSIKDKENPKILKKNILINVVGLINFLEFMNLYNKKIKLFYASSSHIFNDTKTKIQNENTVPNFNSHYALAKNIGKEICDYYREKRNIFCSTGILYSHVSKLSKRNFLIKDLIKQIDVGKKKITVLNSRSQIDLLSVNDVVKAMYKIMKLKKADNFIISSKKPIKVIDIFRKIKKLKKNANVELLDLKKNIINKRTLLKGDNSKLKKKTGWIVGDNIEDIVLDFIIK